MKNKLKHLDLGCGISPKNPYKAKYLYGIDIEIINKNKIQTDCVVKEIKSKNLILDQIPYAEDFFDSISAYDFLEHIPRIISLNIKSKSYTKYAFIELMNEIYRVLKSRGRFYAITPYYPNDAAFQDPTHVNFITNMTHRYFCEPFLLASMYGFKGKFRVIRSIPVKPGNIYEPVKLNFRQKFKSLKDEFRNRKSHLLWEFEAIK
jgi:SAM-dependent methyltransferase